MSPVVPHAAATTDGLWQALADDLRVYFRGRVDAVTADDLLQEVFLRVHRHRDSIRDDTRVHAWVFQIARRVWVDHWRKGDRLDLESECEQWTDHRPELEREDDVRAAEIALGRWLQATIDQLDPKYREALDLVDLQGLSQREAAERLNMSYSGLKSRVQRGRAELRRLLLLCCEVTRASAGGLVEVRSRRCTCC